jgi:Tol biopolymer transport system component
MDPGGDQVTRLTNRPGHDRLPAWSPDGQQIAFVANDGHDDEIYVMDTDPSTNDAPINISNTSTHDSSPAWSPDGQQIAFESDRDRDYEIWVMNNDGSRLKNLTGNRRGDSWPDWQPIVR